MYDLNKEKDLINFFKLKNNQKYITDKNIFNFKILYHLNDTNPGIKQIFGIKIWQIQY